MVHIFFRKKKEQRVYNYVALGNDGRPILPPRTTKHGKKTGRPKTRWLAPAQATSSFPGTLLWHSCEWTSLVIMNIFLACECRLIRSYAKPCACTFFTAAGQGAWEMKPQCFSKCSWESKFPCSVLSLLLYSTVLHCKQCLGGKEIAF